jgi:hypothetical protein
MNHERDRPAPCARPLFSAPTRVGRSLSVLALLVLVGARASAQSTEIWPELDVFWQPAVHQRTFLELSSSTEREGTKREATIGLYQDYLSLPKGYLRAGYRFTFSTRDASYRESRIVGEGVLTAYSSDMVRLLNRTRVELRWVNGAYSYRVRDRLHFQRLAAKGSRFALAPYGTFEVYYDSREASISRVAGRIGSEARLGGPVSIDVYIARQNNLHSTPRYVNALGITTRLNY